MGAEGRGGTRREGWNEKGGEETRREGGDKKYDHVREILSNGTGMG